MPKRPAPIESSFEPRLVPPGTEISYTTRNGHQRTLSADAAGVLTPESAEDVRIIDGFAFEPDQEPRTAAGEEG